MVEQSVTLGSATLSTTGSSNTLVAGSKTFTFSTGTTLSTPTSPSGYIWTGTQSDGSALPLSSVPVVRLCATGAANTTRGYILVASGATALTITSATAATLKGKKLYRRDCGGTSADKSNYLLFNADGTLTIVEGGSTIISGSDVDKFFSAAGYSNDVGNGQTEYGLIKVYQATINGVTRYLAADTGYTVTTATGARTTDYWVDYWIDEGFF